MEKTPQAHKAAAREFVQTAELTTLQVNPKNGAKSIPFKRPIRVRLGGKAARPGAALPLRRAEEGQQAYRCWSRRCARCLPRCPIRFCHGLKDLHA